MSIRVNTDGLLSHTNGTHTPHKGKGTIDHVNCHFDLSNSSAKRKKARNSTIKTKIFSLEAQHFPPGMAT